MPPVVVAAVAAAGTAIGGAVGAFLVMNAGVIATVVMAAGSIAVGSYQKRKALSAARAAYNASLKDRLVMTSTTMGARSRIYGRVRNVDGVLFKATRGTNSEIYTLFIATAGHEIDGFEGVYFDDTLVTLDGSGYVQDEPWRKSAKNSKSQTITLAGGTGAGSVTATGTIVASSVSATVELGADNGSEAAAFTISGSTITITPNAAYGGKSCTVQWQESSGITNARVRFYTGAPGQNVGAVLNPLFPSLVTATDHRFAGIAGLLVDLTYDPDSFPGGVPQISAVMRGAKILDPRTSTTAWTDNPAIIARDWALYAYGGGCAASDLHAASINAAANACDVVQSFPVSTGAQSLKTYTCNIAIRLESDPWLAMQEIVETMAGKIGWSAGQLRMVAGAYRAPVATITEDWISAAEQVNIQPEPATDDAVNIYRATIADAAQKYVEVQAPELRAASYVTADGRELVRETVLGGVTDTTHAQHVCGVLMRESRNGLTVVLPCNLRAFALELFDVVNVTLPTYGWSAKQFEVLDWQFSLDGGVRLTLKETAAAIYQIDSTFAVVDATPNTQLPSPWAVATIGALTISSGTVALSDGTQVSRVLVQWAQPADQAVLSGGHIEVQYWPATDAIPTGDWIAAPNAPGTSTQIVIAGLKASYGYVFRARCVNALGIRGEWGVQASHIVSDAPPLGDAAWDTLFGRPANLAALSGSEAIQNTQITISGNNISGIGTGNGTAVANTGITLTSAGALVGAGGGAIALGSIPGAIAASQFASTIEPVGIVTGSTVPTTKTQNTIYITGLGKLYRWNGAAYVATVPTSDLTGTITSTQITDGAISTPKLAANAVTANELAANSVIAGKVAAGAITATELSVSTLSAVAADTGALSVSGLLTIGTTGAMRGGATSYSSGTGIWQGYDGGQYKVRFGNPTGARAQWDGSTFAIYNASNQVVFSSGGTVNYTQLTGTAPSTIANSSVSIGANGALSGAGGGQVTIGGLGYTGELNATYGADFSEITFGTGINLLYNGDLEAGADYHDKWSAIGIAGENIDASGINLSSSWVIAPSGTPGNNVGYWRATTIGAGHVQNLANSSARLSPPLAVKFGQHYICSAYVGAHRAPVEISVYWFNSSDTYVGSSEGTSGVATCAANEAFGGTTIAEFKRIWVKATPPSGASIMRIVIRKYDTASAQADSYIFYCRAMAEEVSSIATQPGPWVTNGSTDATAVRASNKITSSNISTYIASAAIGWAYIGDLNISTGGGIRSGKTAYGSGTGWLIEYNGGTPRLDIGDTNQYVRWDGSQLLVKLNKVTLSATNLTSGSFPKNDGVVRSLGSTTVTASGGTTPYTYSWSYTWDFNGTVNDVDNRGYASFSSNTASASARGDTDCAISVTVTCTVTDANGLTATISRSATGTFGSGPP